MANKLMTCPFAICFVFGAIVSFAQVDSVVVIRRNDVDTKFTYRKYKAKSELQEVKFPHFSTTKNNIARITSLLSEFTQMEAKYTALTKVNSDLDSIRRAKEKKLEETIELEKQRADNFEQTNKSLVMQYNALDGTLKDCQNLALTAKKENWWRGAKQVGILALAAGVVAGVLIAK